MDTGQRTVQHFIKPTFKRRLMHAFFVILLSPQIPIGLLQECANGNVTLVFTSQATSVMLAPTPKNLRHRVQLVKWKACTTEADGACQACPQLDSTDNLVYVETSNCKTQCISGYFREAFGDTLVCSKCSELQDIQATLDLLVRNADADYYWFQACTEISDLQPIACVDPTLTGTNSDFTFTGDATAIHTSEYPAACQYSCAVGYESSVTFQSKDVTTSIALDSASEAEESSVTITEPLASCSPCSPITTSVTLGTEFTPFYKQDEGCTLFCPTDAVVWEHHGNTHDNVCRRCVEADCGIGQEINCNTCKSDAWNYGASYNCLNFCTACPSLQDINSEYFVAGSCDSRCREGYFYHEVLGCVPHAHMRADCVSDLNGVAGAGYWWQGGDTLFDSACRVCTSCEGQSLATACLCVYDDTLTAEEQAECNDAVCEACVTPPGANSHYVGTSCSKTECNEGYIRNIALTPPVCEPCDVKVCRLGQTFTENRQHCSDCRDCNTVLSQSKPDNAIWLALGSCDWSCSDGQIVLDTASGPLCANDPSKTVYADKLVQQMPVASRVLCAAHQFLDRNYECQDCYTNTHTPAKSDEGKTWVWVDSSKNCDWQCLQDYIVYHDKNKRVHCFTFDQYRSTAVIAANTARVDKHFAERFHHIDVRQERLSAWDLGQLVLVLVACVAMLTGAH